MNNLLVRLLFCLIFVVPAFLGAQNSTTRIPGKGGLSKEKLTEISGAIQKYIDNNETGGAMTMVARKGEVVHFETYGMQNKKAGTPVAENTIFRIFSMTKPITTTALMMLYEEGKVKLDDPVEKYIPEFADVKVYHKDGQQLPAKNKMTVRHILSHSSGLSYGWDPTPVDTMYQKANFWFSASLKQMIQKIASLPLNFEPGTQWKYGVSTDVAGYLVEVISGQPFDQFLKEHIFEPLKMEDTGFHVPEDKHARLATVYSKDKEGNLIEMHTPTVDHFYQPAPYASGGGGLVSTASDYMTFAQMLLNGGEINGVRILKKETVDMMRSNQLADGVKYGPGKSFGLGFDIMMDVEKAEGIGSNGTYSWSGLANTYFWIDPEQEMVLMVWTQFLPHGTPMSSEFKKMVYEALVN